MNCEAIVKKLKLLGSQKNAEGMARFGISPKTRVLGIPIPKIRKIAKQIGRNHSLALKLWDLKIHEARILSGLLASPEELTENQIDKWVKGFDSWDVVDQICMNLFDKSGIAVEKIPEFSRREKEFEKRTAFALMAALAFHDKKMPDEKFLRFFPFIKRASVDERNFVKKAVNWALRQIGKRNKRLNKEAVKLAKEIQLLAEKNNLRGAMWIANDAIRELTSEAVRKRLSK